MAKFRAPLLLLLLYWATRLWQLLILPTFTDEGIYIRRGLLVSGGAWAAEIVDGTVLHPRLLATFLQFVSQSIDSLLLFARGFNVAFDAIAFMTLYVIARKQFTQRAAILAALFYIVCPFVFFYDRMALADGPLMTFYALTFWLCLRIAEGGRRWRSSVALGFVLAAASFTKLSGVIFVMVPLFAVLSAANWRGAIRQWPYWALAYLLSLVLYVPALLYGVGQYQFGAKTVSTLDPGELLAQVNNNLGSVVEWLTAYAPGPLILLMLVAALLALRLRRAGLLWLAGALWPIAFFVLVARVWYPRYILMSMVPIAVLVGWCCDQFGALAKRWNLLWGGRAAAVALFIVAVPALHFDYLLLTDPSGAPWPAIERWQYVSGWPSGYGVESAISALQQLADDSPGGINVMRYNKGGPQLETLDLYLWQNHRIGLYAADFAGSNPRPTLNGLVKQKPTYIILDPPREGIVFSENYPRAIKVAEFPKPGGESSILIYQWP